MSQNTHYLDDEIVVLGHAYKIRFYPDHVRGKVFLTAGWSRDGQTFTMVPGQDSGDGAKDRLRERVAAAVHRAHHELRAQTPPAVILVFGHDLFGCEMVVAELSAHHSELFNAAPNDTVNSLFTGGEAGAVNRVRLRDFCTSIAVPVLHCPVNAVTELLAACKELRIGTFLIEVERPLASQFEDVLLSYRNDRVESLREHGLKLMALVEPALSGAGTIAGVQADMKVTGLHKPDADSLISKTISWCKLQSLKRAVD